MAQLLFVSAHGTWAQSTINYLLVRFLLLTAWLPHHSLLPSRNFGLVSWLAASACAQLMYLWAQDLVNQRAQSRFRWAADVKQQQTLGEEMLPECIWALLAFYSLVNILQFFFFKNLQRTCLHHMFWSRTNTPQIQVYCPLSVLETLTHISVKALSVYPDHVWKLGSSLHWSFLLFPWWGLTDGGICMQRHFPGRLFLPCFSHLPLCALRLAVLCDWCSLVQMVVHLIQNQRFKPEVLLSREDSLTPLSENCLGWCTHT